MESSVIEKKGLKRKLQFTVEEPVVQKSFSSEYSKVQKQAQLPGFRAGKAPMEVIKKNYYRQVWKSVLDDLFKSFYPEALKSSKIQAVTSPTLVDINLEENKPCTFTLEVEVHPEVEVKKYKGLEITKRSREVTEKDLEDALKNLQKNLADKETKKLPDLNDEFAKKFKVDSLAELKERIKKDIKNSKESQAQDQEENEVIDRFIEANPVELPEGLILDQKQHLIENSRERLKSFGMGKQEQDKWLQEKDKEFDKEARRSLHSSYIVDELVKKLKLEVSKEDIEKSLKESFPSKKPEEMEQELKKQNYWTQFLFNLSRKKALDLLLEKAVKKEEKAATGK